MRPERRLGVLRPILANFSSLAFLLSREPQSLSPDSVSRCCDRLRCISWASDRRISLRRRFASPASLTLGDFPSEDIVLDMSRPHNREQGGRCSSGSFASTTLLALFAFLYPSLVS